MGYTANFIQGRNGNSLPYGEDLIVSVPGAKIVTGTLSKKSGLGWKIIQIDQSGNTANPQTDKIKFEMKEKQIINGILTTVAMPRGKYRIKIGAHGNPGNTSDFNFWTDVFEVI